MFERGTLFAAVVAAAMGGPYLLLNTNVLSPSGAADGGSSFTMPWTSGAAREEVAPSAPWAWNPATSAGPPPLAEAMAPMARPRLEGPAALRLEDAFRFDLSPLFVTHNWARVSTVVAELELEGMRVPLVSGANPDDISGALTYYFDKRQRLQRISFHGATGDPRRLVAFLTQYHHLEATPALGAGLYQARWNGEAKSVLRLSHAPVISAGAPLTRYEVALELNRADDYYRLSPEMQQLLGRDQQAGRF